MSIPDSQLFRDVFNASPIGIVVESLDGQPLFANPSFCSFLGFSEDELFSKHCVDFSPAEDAVKDWALFQQLRAGSINHYQLEKRYFRRDGSLVWGRLSISLLKSHPSPLVLAMVEDITDAKLAEESRFRHAAIVQSSVDAIISKDLNGLITSWNTGAERIFGYTESEVIGKPITIVIPSDLRDEADRILERLRSGGRIEHLDTKRVTKAGNKVDVSLTIVPIKDASGTVVGFAKLAQDITHRKQAEEALRELNRSLEEQTALLQSREELLKIFVKNVPAGVAMLDRDMRYLQVSDRWCADYGVNASQVLGRSHYELFPDIPERWKEMHRRALDGETLRADEDRWDRPSGTTWVRWELRPWTTAGGSLGGILIFAEDITHRKQMEEAVEDISRRLIQSQEQERTRIGRELHDDINQRLALFAIELEKLKENPSEIETRVQALLQQTNEIANDVQALSHELHSSKLEYLGAIPGIKSWCKEFGERQGMEIDLKADVASPVSSEIGVTLFRILQEALHNGVKHSGVKKIEVQLWEQSDEIHLEVRDAGKGFEIGAARQGRGVGLASMDERVRLVRGTIAIDSRLNHGTHIHARIPLKQDQASRRAAG
jgi:PAS domain S-box-containing protein